MQGDRSEEELLQAGAGGVRGCGEAGDHLRQLPAGQPDLRVRRLATVVPGGDRRRGAVGSDGLGEEQRTEGQDVRGAGEVGRAEAGDEGGLRAVDEGEWVEGIRADCRLQDRERPVDHREWTADTDFQAEEAVCSEGVEIRGRTDN